MKKQSVDRSVYDLALERIDRCYDLFDNVAVSFSGGKDSTVAFQLTYQVAQERHRLPLDVVFFDEECIPPETVAYVARIAQMDGVALRGYCLPVKHRNACSRRDPWWYPWDPDKRELWVRELPSQGITELLGFDRHAIPDMSHLLFDKALGTTAFILGIRADESLRRYRSVTRKIHDNCIAWEANGYTAKVKPIYDWLTDDVWVAPHRFGWDYNPSYALMEKLGMSRHQQRIAPPFGEEPAQNLSMFHACWPELWDKMIRRVDGAATAARYSQTELYGFGGMTCPDGASWQAQIERFIQRHPEDVRAGVAHRIKTLIEQHWNKTGEPLAERDHPVSGLGFRRLASIALRGDLKRRRGARF